MNLGYKFVAVSAIDPGRFSRLQQTLTKYGWSFNSPEMDTQTITKTYDALELFFSQ